MSGTYLPVFCLCVMTMLQLTSSQMWHGASWNTGHIGNSGWNTQFFGRRRNDEADRAVCVAIAYRSRKEPLVIVATLKRTSSNWAWGRSGLSLDVKVDSTRDDRRVSLVITEFGRTPRKGGCSNDDLGDIVTRKNDFRSLWQQSGNDDGVIATFNLKDGLDETFSGRDLPIDKLEDAFGRSLAVCTEVEERESGESHNGWAWNWAMRNRRRSTFECRELTPLCCIFARSDDDAEAPKNRRC